MSGKSPIYNLLNGVIAEAGDWESEVTMIYTYYHKKFELRTKWFGVPGDYKTRAALPYIASELAELGKWLTFLSDGNTLSEEKLSEYVILYNEIRDLLKEISYLRKVDSPPISGLDFIKLNHYSFYCEPHKYVESLKSICQELRDAKGKYPKNAPRIAIFGSPIAQGDYCLPRLIEDAGGAIVIEELCGGLRHYETKTKVDGDLVENLVKRYYGIAPGPMMFPWGQRISLFEKYIRDFRVDGIIWYQLMYQTGFDYERAGVSEKLKEMGIPMLVIDSEYDIEERLESNRTRVETFLEVVRTGMRRQYK
jgi:benzoyl-CoA reductase/2-hydroxyglutaryl-CoA dehydratase subunit BcrC/BadD/HgdB